MAPGIYIHIPFCVAKCKYCDFYSLPFSKTTEEVYTKRILSELERWSNNLNCSADTLYFGGGTPSLLNPKNIVRIINRYKELFSPKNAEITMEANPAENLYEYFKTVSEGGINRVSLGLQSSNDNELSLLGRRHSASDVKNAVNAAKAAGIQNISLDVMLGIPNQTEKTLSETLKYAVDLGPEHISTYILSLEKGTPLYNKRNEYNIPNADETTEFYLYTCDFLRKSCFERYEISNFAKNHKVSRHNLKYWTGEEYLGLGPSAHSFINGKRFYYSNNLNDYVLKPNEISDGTGGGYEEKVMLNLRLNKGISLIELFNEYKQDLNSQTIKRIKEKANCFSRAGYVCFDGDVITLTDKGALVSNTIISEILMCF